MKKSLHFDPHSHQITGPTGSLSIPAHDQQAHHFIMLLEGQCLKAQIAAVAKKYGYCRQRYYQILDAFKTGGLPALEPKKTGPKSNYRRTDQVVRQILRYRFLDPDASPDVIAQKLRQTHFSISLRSVERVLADYGVQKKTLRAQPQKPAAPAAGSKHSKKSPARPRRPSQPRTPGSATPG